MGFFKRQHQPYMTDADRKRIADIDNNPYLLNRKCKYGMMLKHPSIDAEVYIIVYGKDADDVQQKIDANVKFFKDTDKKWSLIKQEDLKATILDDD